MVRLIVLCVLPVFLLCLFAEAALVRSVRVARPHLVVAGRAPVRAMHLRACNRAGYETFMVAVDWSTVGPPDVSADVLARLQTSACRRCGRGRRVRGGCMLLSLHDHQFQLHWFHESSLERLSCLSRHPPELVGLCVPCACGSCVLNWSQNSSMSCAGGAGVELACGACAG